MHYCPTMQRTTEIIFFKEILIKLQKHLKQPLPFLKCVAIVKCTAETISQLID